MRKQEDIGRLSILMILLTFHTALNVSNIQQHLLTFHTALNVSNILQHLLTFHTALNVSNILNYNNNTIFPSKEMNQSN